MQTFIQFTINESSLSRVLEHTHNRNIGMMTAHRGEFTAAENHERNKNLENDIRKAGHGFIHVKGRYTENKGMPNERQVDEHSYLIAGKKGDDKGALKQFMIHHGKKYGQDSVLHKGHNDEHAFLHGTREGGWPGIGQSHNVGHFHPNRAGEFHSVMSGGRTFDFHEGLEPVEIEFGTLQFLTAKGYFSREETEF